MKLLCVDDSPSALGCCCGLRLPAAKQAGPAGRTGFKTLSLNTPAKVAAFKKLPPQRLSQTTFKGKSVWVYPDRNVCGCLYIGGQTAYNTYIKSATQQMIDTRVNQMYDNNASDPYNPAAEMAS